MKTEPNSPAIPTKDSALREVRKLADVLRTHGNVLVPSLPNQKETCALERFQYFANHLINVEKMTTEEIEQAINELNKTES